MSKSREWQTGFLWTAFLGIISILLLLIVALLVYLPFKNELAKHFNKPKYDKTELAIKTKERLKSMKNDWDRVEGGIHVKTGLAFDKNFKYIRNNCISCHSAKMIIQNRATRDGWKQMIRWMQETQGLQDLGDNEVYILDYLATHYAPKETGRRPNIDIEAIEWYVLNLN